MTQPPEDWFLLPVGTTAGASPPTILAGLTMPSELTRANQFRALDPDSRRIVDMALSRGWTARVSKRGHVILRSPDGNRTESITKNLSRRGSGRDRALKIIQGGADHEPAHQNHHR